MTYYDREGNPISLEGWAHLIEKHEDYRRVASTVIPETNVWVSTVWLGLDHNYWGGPPLIFETMVWNEHGADDEICERWSSENEAVAGHLAVVSALLAATGADRHLPEDTAIPLNDPPPGP